MTEVQESLMMHLKRVDIWTEQKLKKENNNNKGREEFNHPRVAVRG